MDTVVYTVSQEHQRYLDGSHGPDVQQATARPPLWVKKVLCCQSPIPPNLTWKWMLLSNPGSWPQFWYGEFVVHVTYGVIVGSAKSGHAMRWARGSSRTGGFKAKNQDQLAFATARSMLFIHRLWYTRTVQTKQGIHHIWHYKPILSHQRQTGYHLRSWQFAYSPDNLVAGRLSI